MNDIIAEVLSKYGIRPQKWTIIKQESDRMVFKIEGEQEIYALKSLIDRVAQNVSNLTLHLIKRGIPLIPILPTLNGDFVVKSNKCNNSFILFPWFEGEPIIYETPGTINKMTTLLAQFHEASKSYNNTGNPINRILFDMLKVYKKKLKFIEKTYQEVNSSDDQILRLVASHYFWIKKRCDWVIKELPRTSYNKLIKLAESDPTLGHGDYSRANILSDKLGNWKLIDLDVTGLSLPFVDLSRMITWMNHDLQNWDPNRYQTILQYYRHVRPFSEEEEELLIIDQCFPHQFIDLVRGIMNNRREILLDEFQNCLATDKQKIKNLSKEYSRMEILLKDI